MLTGLNEVLEQHAARSSAVFNELCQMPLLPSASSKMEGHSPYQSSALQHATIASLAQIIEKLVLRVSKLEGMVFALQSQSDAKMLSKVGEMSQHNMHHVLESALKPMQEQLAHHDRVIVDVVRVLDEVPRVVDSVCSPATSPVNRKAQGHPSRGGQASVGTEETTTKVGQAASPEATNNAHVATGNGVSGVQEQQSTTPDRNKKNVPDAGAPSAGRHHKNEDGNVPSETEEEAATPTIDPSIAQRLERLQMMVSSLKHSVNHPEERQVVYGGAAAPQSHRVRLPAAQPSSGNETTTSGGATTVPLERLSNDESTTLTFHPLLDMTHTNYATDSSMYTSTSQEQQLMHIDRQLGGGGGTRHYGNNYYPQYLRGGVQQQRYHRDYLPVGLYETPPTSSSTTGVGTHSDQQSGGTPQRQQGDPYRELLDQLRARSGGK